MGDIDFMQYEWQQEGVEGGDFWQKEYMPSNKVSRVMMILTDSQQHREGVFPR